jgi:hypothetical protein
MQSAKISASSARQAIIAREQEELLTLMSVMLVTIVQAAIHQRHLEQLRKMGETRLLRLVVIVACVQQATSAPLVQLTRFPARQAPIKMRLGHIHMKAHLSVNLAKGLSTVPAEA